MSNARTTRVGGGASKAFSLVVVLALLAAIATSAFIFTQSAQADETSTSPKSINIGASCITVPEAGWSTADGNYLYYGSYKGAATKYRVLTNNGATMLIDSDVALWADYFSAATETDYAESTIYSYLKNATDADNNTLFSNNELGSIVTTNLSAADSYSAGSATYSDTAASDNKSFLLTANEANTLYKDNSARKKTGSGGYWWMRSKLDNFSTSAGCVVPSGALNRDNVHAYQNGVAPASYLSTSNILFTTANTFDKTADLAAVSDATSNEWKVTLKDTNQSVTVTSVTEEGNDLTVNYTATGDDATQVSVAITSDDISLANTEVLYYGKLGDASATSGTFTLPTDLPDGYKIYVLAEDANGVGYTDYASEPVEVVKEYSVNYFVDGEEQTDLAETVEEGNVATDPSDELTKDGYTLDGWYVNKDFTGDAFDFATAITQDTSLYAQWVPVEYGITYKLGEGGKALNANNPEKYTIETETFTLADPTPKDGYKFVNWTDEDGNVVSEIKVGSMGEMTLTANFEKVAAQEEDTTTSQTATSQTTTSQSATPKTADANVSLIWLVLLATSASAAGCVIAISKRKKASQSFMK